MRFRRLTFLLLGGLLILAAGDRTYRPPALAAPAVAPTPTVAEKDSAPGRVDLIVLDNQIISPVTENYIDSAIARAEDEGAVCLVIELDTPGGLLESTHTIVRNILNARVPVVVYVAPSGARAGSAGVFITLAAHVAAMAPSTNIGAAHPVTLDGGGDFRKFFSPGGERPGARSADDATTGGATAPGGERYANPMSEKIVNDTVAWITAIARLRGRNEAWARRAVTESVSVTDEEALKEHIVDFIATNLNDLLARLDGRPVKLPTGVITLHTAGARVVSTPMGLRQRFLSVIVNPNVAYLLMMLGVLGLIFEFTHPGIGFPGIAGLICLLLALYSFQTLPVNYAGFALILLGLVMLVAEIKIMSHGLLALGGILSLVLGSLMLFEEPGSGIRVSLGIVIPAVGTLAAIVLFVVHRAVGSVMFPVATGAQELVGMTGHAATDLSPRGTVFVHGELWAALATAPVGKGQPVRVLRVEGLRLTVEPADHESTAGEKQK
ncbi:MAG: nodulation protein NfeD [bacterium]|nr:nodulation protein NfeD [bacterium]